MTAQPEQTARGVLAELEERLATHDLERMADFFTDDVVLIGDAVENFTRDTTVSYLGLMADMAPTVRWNWDRVVVVLDEPGVLVFAAAGSMEFHDAGAQPLSEPEPFRLTCLAVEEDAGWRLKHFHGSRPAED